MKARRVSMTQGLKGLAIAAVGVTLLAVAAAAQVREHGGSGRPGRGFGGGFPMRGLERLNLTDEQRAEVRKIFDERREASRPSFDEIRKLERELQAAVLADTTSLETIRDLTTRIADAHKAQVEARVATELKIVQLLTPEQKQQLSDLWSSRGRSGEPGER
jgi:protein CpxP